MAIRRSRDDYNAAFECKVIEQQIRRLVDEYNRLWGSERRCTVAFEAMPIEAPQVAS